MRVRGMTDHEESDIEFRARARLGTWLKDKYRLDRVIGSGGMAVVYAATHRNQAEFAVKMLHRELSLNQDVRTRFLREGYAANSVKHRGAVRVHDDDVSEDGSAFLVMELLQGVLVEELWTRSNNRLDPQAVLGVGYQLLDVLAAAHAHQVVHRDIKPANIFLTQEGVIKVLDFGIARLRDVALGSLGSVAPGKGTQTGLMMGTPAFMAPEQAMAKPAEIDAQTDVWAVGATLFTLISGMLVHEGDNAQQLLIRAATTPARSLASVAPEVPQAVAQVIDTALAFDKAARWPDATAMREAMREACLATYGEAPSRRRLMALLGDDAVSPDSTERLHALPESLLKMGPPGAAPGVSGAMSTNQPVAATYGASARSATYRPSTELTSSSAAELAPIVKTGPRPAVMVVIGVCAFALAFGVGIVVHGWRARTAETGVAVPAGNPPPVTSPVTTQVVVVPPPPPPGGSPAPPGASGTSPPPAVSATPSSTEAPSAAPAKRHHRHEPSPPSDTPKPSGPTAEPASPEPPQVDCSVPFTLDADGNKKWKMECVGH